MILAKNIRYLRKLNNLSQEDIAKKLGYKSFTTIQKWEDGTSEPPLEKLYELSIIFGFNINDMFSKELYNKMTFNNRLKEARKKANMTQQQLADKLGLVKSTITGYEKGKSEPSISTIYKIMDILNVDANFLFSANTDEKVTKDTNNNIIEHYNDLNLIDKGLVNLLINRLMEDYQ